MGTNSFAEGYNTISAGSAQHVEGKYNIKDTSSTYAHIVGNGISDTARSNAYTLDWNGNAWYAGNLTIEKTGSEAFMNFQRTDLDMRLGTTDANGSVGGFHYYDSNGDLVMYLESKLLTGDKTRAQLYARRTDANGTKYSHGFGIVIDEQGNGSVEFSSTAFRDAWADGMNVVKKAGDTMTGNLTLPNVNLNSSIDTSLDNTRSATQFLSGIYAYDGNNRNIFYNEIALATDRIYRSYVVRGFNSNGTEVGRNGFYLDVMNDGTIAVRFANDATREAWANALNVVKKAGDTMAGNLVARFSGFDLSKSNNGVASTQYPTTFCIEDSAGRIATRIEGAVSSNGNMASYWYVRNYNTSGTQVAQKGIQMTMNKSGTLTYTVSDPANFRSAIGAVNRAGDTMTASFTLSASDTTGRFWKVKNSKHEGSFYVDSSGNLGIWSDTKSKWVIRSDASGNVYLNNHNLTNGIKGWTQIAQVQGTNSATYSLSGYTECLLMIWHGTDYFGTCVFPANAIGSTQYEMYTGGWGNKNTVSNRAGCAKVSNTKLTGVMVKVDNPDVTSSSYFRLYAR